MTDFRALISLLAGAGIEFIIVGGAAATAHGSARLTRDLDVVYRRTEKNIERLVRALTPYEPYLRGAPTGLPFSWDERTIAKGLNFTLTTTVGMLDLARRNHWRRRLRRLTSLFHHPTPVQL